MGTRSELGFIVSPAKKMNVVEGPPWAASTPRFLDDAARLAHEVGALSYGEAKALWKCSDKLAVLNYDRFAHMDLSRDVTAAVLAYEGIQYQHLAPQVLDEEALGWLEGHLRILSGMYGVLRPCDGVVPYRLEMQACLAVDDHRDLYAYWGDRLAGALAVEFSCVVNVASMEYAKAVTPHLPGLGVRVITCLFGDVREGRLVQRSTEAKAARGTFVRWCAEHGVTRADGLATFSERGYALDERLSSPDTLVFVRERS